MCSTESCCYKLHHKHTLPQAGQLQHLHMISVSNIALTKLRGFLSTHGDIKLVQIKYQFDTFDGQKSIKQACMVAILRPQILNSRAW
jgi:hypothetical protein